MNISSSYASGRLTVFLAGELDHHVAREALRQLDELLDEYMPRDCVVDLGDLSFMDSSGIALIIRVSRRMRDLGGRARMEHAVGQPRRVLDASGIDRLIPMASGKQEEYI